MATGADNAPLRATIAALAAVAALLGFVIWQNAAATLRANSEEARIERSNAAVLAIARELERNGSSSTLQDTVAAVGKPAVAAVFDASGQRVEYAWTSGLDDLATRLPARSTAPDSSQPVVVDGSGDDLQILAVGISKDRTLVVGLPARPTGALGSTLAGYEALTLVVVLAAIAFGMRRLGRATQARFEPKHAGVGAAASGPNREADFVVETFQSVIGELQVKGRQLELASMRERERADRSERFSERVIAQMPTGLVVVDQTGLVTAANASARELFTDLPRSRKEAVDYTRAFASAEELVRMIGECLREGAFFARREIEMRSAVSSEARCLGVSVSPIAPEGAPEAALCLMTDLTEVVDLRDRVRMQETMASLGEMAAGLTHELKSSLATIQGFAQLIAGIAPERASEPAEELVREVGNLSRMVTDFLNFARPDEVARAPVAIGDLVESIVERLEPRLVEAGIEYSLEVAGDAGTALILGDETLVGRALLNVVQNAVDALESNEPPRRLSLVVSKTGDEVAVEIRDNGPGIAPADLAKIFIPFFTTRSRGHGIGLALTQKIVLAHGGRIAVEDAGPGAVFVCVFPAAESVGSSLPIP